MGNKLDPSFVVGLVSLGSTGKIRVAKARTFDARADARTYAIEKNLKRRSSTVGEWLVIPTTPGPIVRK